MKSKTIKVEAVMKIKFILCLELVLCVGLFGCATNDEQSRQYISRSANPSELPEILWYEKPSPETLKNIKIARISLTKDELNKLAALPKDPTNRASWPVEEDPDTMRDGPWKTDIYIFDTSDTNHCVRIELIDHVSGGVKHTWLNNKILFVEVWWGHIGFTDFILNTETLKFLYMEDGFDTVASDDNLQTTNDSLTDLPIRYHNAKYDLTFYLPESWKGYSVLTEPFDVTLYSTNYQNEIGTEHLQKITLRNPKWTESDPYKDILILVYTHKQWDEENQERLNSHAGGFIEELWHNDKYIFGMPNRWYSDDFEKGLEETETVLQRNCAAHLQLHVHEDEK